MINPLLFLYTGLAAAGIYAVIFLVGTYVTRRNSTIICVPTPTKGQWIYSQNDIRRQDRLLDENKAREILKTGEYGYLSMVDAEGYAYGVPLNFVYDGDGAIYIHCAPEGRKLRTINSHPQVSFCVVGNTCVVSHKFTTAYESVVLSCNATDNIQEDERRRALALLLDKYSPADKDTGLIYAEKSFARTAIIRLDIQSVSGKAKSVGK
ncbi:MAG: pyridoxamine 5'-phosphate oxidase family protein [Duncaniella sp.]|nr:pyridoxamine 5'-phosphate oxidase family protein [Duncaniella sp.]